MKWRQITNSSASEPWRIHISWLLPACAVYFLSAEPLTICCDDPYWVRESLRENDSASRSGHMLQGISFLESYPAEWPGFREAVSTGKETISHLPWRRLLSLLPLLWNKFWEIKTHSSYARTKIFLKRVLIRTWRNWNSRPLRGGM